MESPNPLPLPCSLVVKKGSNNRERVSASMPDPVSLTASITYAPGFTPAFLAAASSSSRLEVSSTSLPPLGMASRALVARFTMACCIWAPSICTGPSRVVAQGFRLLASDFWLLNIDKFLSMLALQAPKATMRSNGMRDDRYVLAIDMGSSSVKATLVSQRGELAGTGLRNVDILLLPGGGAEQDPEQWWDAAISAAKSALATAAIPPERIVAVACTTQWAVTVPVDEDGHAIWNALSWMDTRGGRYSRAAVDGWPKIEGYAVYKLLKWVRLTGAAPNHSGVDGFGHILYFKHERPDLYARTYKFLEPMDYLNFRLTGRCAASYSTIFPYWLTDNRNPNRIDYHPALLRAAGIERSKMPDLRPVDAVLGELKPQVAAELGLLPGTRVVMGSGDSQAATVGAGCVRDYDGYFCIGTTAWLSCHVPWKKTGVAHSLATMPAALPGRYMVSAEQ